MKWSYIYSEGAADPVKLNSSLVWIYCILININEKSYEGKGAMGARIVVSRLETQ